MTQTEIGRACLFERPQDEEILDDAARERERWEREHSQIRYARGGWAIQQAKMARAASVEQKQKARADEAEMRLARIQLLHSLEGVC